MARSPQQLAQLKALPRVDDLARLLSSVSPTVAVAAARQVISEAREQILSGQNLSQNLDKEVARRARWLSSGKLKPVINATGVVLHTNLGRAGYCDAARDAAVSAMGYCNLEYDRATGRRGGRLAGVRAQLRALTGAEDSVVVNNNAAAVFLVLTALAKDREVVVSRGELVEIGGSFRVPDVIQSGGAQLVEVGTTNRTRAADYERAITANTACLLKVHPSNFHQVGFVEQASREELSQIAKRHEVIFVEDLGSGSVIEGGSEPSVSSVVKSGVHLVTFSGDKLLGGPQAGIIVGQRRLIALVRQHALYRALRVGKVCLAALEATLAQHLLGNEVGVQQMLGQRPPELKLKADWVCEALVEQNIVATTKRAESLTGGGAEPDLTLASWVVCVSHKRINALTALLREGEPCVVGRIRGDQLLLDMRTISSLELPVLVERLAAAFVAL